MSSSSRVFNKIRNGSKSAQFIEGLIRSADHGESRQYSTIGAMRTSGISLVRKCYQCGYQSDVDISAEVDEHGEDAPLTAIGGVCPSCDAKKISVIPA